MRFSTAFRIILPTPDLNDFIFIFKGKIEKKRRKKKKKRKHEFLKLNEER
jgi:hypothetical protein